MAELKKCPFCGGEAEIQINRHREYASTYSVTCKKRCVNVYDTRTKSEAVEKWNNRATEAEIRAKAIDEFAEKLKEEYPIMNNCFGYGVNNNLHRSIDEIAEQLKEE